MRRMYVRETGNTARIIAAGSKDEFMQIDCRVRPVSEGACGTDLTVPVLFRFARKVLC